MERNMNMPAVLAVTAAIGAASAVEAQATHDHPETRVATEQEMNCARLAATAFDGFRFAYNGSKATITADPQNPAAYNCDPAKFDRITVGRISEYTNGKFVKHLTNSARVLSPANDGGSEASRTINIKKAACGRATRLALTSTVTVPGTNFKVVNTERTSSVATKCTTRRVR